jgi:hypothetical protein
MCRASKIPLFIILKNDQRIFLINQRDSLWKLKSRLKNLNRPGYVELTQVNICRFFREK